MQNECVFLHGWGMNQNVWQLLIPELELDCPVTLIIVLLYEEVQNNNPARVLENP